VSGIPSSYCSHSSARSIKIHQSGWVTLS
jgi:hypothetical protein